MELRYKKKETKKAKEMKKVKEMDEAKEMRIAGTIETAVNE